MDTTSQIFRQQGALDAQDVSVLLKALGQWGVAEEAGVSGEALENYASEAQAAFQRVALAA